MVSAEPWSKQLKDGRWEAQVDLIKMALEEEFNHQAEKEAAQPKKRQVNVVKTRTRVDRARLDLRENYEEAMQELDGFIDQRYQPLAVAQSISSTGSGRGVIP